MSWGALDPTSLRCSVACSKGRRPILSLPLVRAVRSIITKGCDGPTDTFLFVPNVPKGPTDGSEASNVPKPPLYPSHHSFFHFHFRRVIEGAKGTKMHANPASKSQLTQQITCGIN